MGMSDLKAKHVSPASIARYGAAALAIGAGIATGPKAEAAIVYTDIPDMAIFNSVYDLDLNRDSVFDLAITHGPFLESVRVRADAADANTVAVEVITFRVEALASGVTLPDDVEFGSDGATKLQASRSRDPAADGAGDEAANDQPADFWK